MTYHEALAYWFAHANYEQRAPSPGDLKLDRMRALLARLGDRPDSTNVCLPVLAVITSISLDHVRILGDKLSSIAREKAGIVKPGRPVISGATAPEARAVIEEVCRRRKAPLTQLGVDFRFDHEPGVFGETDLPRPRVQVTTQERAWPAMQLNLLGAHQGANAALVVA